MSFESATPDPWMQLRQLTSARLALGRSGGSLPTKAVLEFSLDHALAQDAVHVPFDATALAEKLRILHSDVLLLASAAADRATYLQRPNLGRRLAHESMAILETREIFTPPPDLVIIISDGLSALAAQRQAPPLLAALLPLLRARGFTLAPLCITRHARVALMDDVGARLHAQLALILLGERPGLGTPDSLGAYSVYGPGPGRTDADRNCVSNIRPEGLSSERAAEKLAALLTVARARKLSGVGLKEDDTTLEAPSAPISL